MGKGVRTAGQEKPPRRGLVSREASPGKGRRGLSTDRDPGWQRARSGTRREAFCMRPRYRGEVGCSQVPRGLPKGRGTEVTFYAESGRRFKSLSLGEMNSLPELYF